MIITRRRALLGLIATPAVVKFGSLMPVRGIIMPMPFDADMVHFAGNPTFGAWIKTSRPGWDTEGKAEITKINEWEYVTGPAWQGSR